MKKIADKGRREKSFEVGDWVWVKPQAYRQLSLTQRKNWKLAAKYVGPYQIQEKIGFVAYKLKLPTSSKVHPVFHVSLLKPYFGPPVTEPEDNHTVPPPSTPLPRGILSTRTSLVNGQPQTQVLIDWEGFPPEEATWEVWDHILQQYPDLEDKVNFNGEADDTTQPREEVQVSSKRARGTPKYLKDYVSK